MKISWAITVCDEDKELHILLTNLLKHISPSDELIIQADESKVTKKVETIIEGFSNQFPIKYIKFPLNKDFSSFKNNLKANCTGDYLYQIDADENVNPWIIKNLSELLSNNTTVDLIWVPRVNVVEEITEEYIKKMRWRMDEFGRINYPDYQPRIIKNKPEISWRNKVHEQITGHEIESNFPLNDEYFDIIHIKSFDKQKQQNRFYSEIQP